MKKLFTTLFLTIALFAMVSAQSAIVPTGGTASGNGGTVTYTVGQIAVQTNSDGTTTISEGVQQPFEISVVGVDDYPGITLNAVIYPNPTQGIVQLEITNFQLEGEIHVYDVSGKFLLKKTIEGQTTQMDLSTYAPGTYYLSVYSNSQKLKTFKVVKAAR